MKTCFQSTTKHKTLALSEVNAADFSSVAKSTGPLGGPNSAVSFVLGWASVSMLVILLDITIGVKIKWLSLGCSKIGIESMYNEC